ncbi:MAG: metal-dependent hydrolase [Kiritimatiellae bacterium]|nr:metal-dependent hydrolase [Kiritimatiellia bacterium]
MASCFPAVVEAGASGNPLYFVLAGISGLLPDTLDFKFYRFFYKYDLLVAPDPHDFDAQKIADGIAYAVNKAHNEGRPVKVKLSTIMLGPDLWQRYRVEFDVANNAVCVCAGPVVDTGGKPVRHEQKECTPGRSDLHSELKLDYQAVIEIDIFDGPIFRMTPSADGKIIPEFIPWHREWSHSFVLSLLLALLSAVIWGTLAGIVVFIAYSAHIIADQFGFMGSALFYPFQRKRIPGYGITHSGHAGLNLSAVWISCLLIFWNLYNALPWITEYMNPLKLIFFGLGIPAALFYTTQALLKLLNIRKQGARRGV